MCAIQGNSALGFGLIIFIISYVCLGQVLGLNRLVCLGACLVLGARQKECIPANAAEPLGNNLQGHLAGMDLGGPALRSFQSHMLDVPRKWC